jgi:hypothetical protein
MHCIEADALPAFLGHYGDVRYQPLSDFFDSLQNEIAAWGNMSVACETAIQACQAVIDAATTLDPPTIKNAKIAAYNKCAVTEVAQAQAMTTPQAYV